MSYAKVVLSYSRSCVSAGGDGDSSSILIVVAHAAVKSRLHNVGYRWALLISSIGPCTDLVCKRIVSCFKECQIIRVLLFLVCTQVRIIVIGFEAMEVHYWIFVLVYLVDVALSKVSVHAFHQLFRVASFEFRLQSAFRFHETCAKVCRKHIQAN